MTANKKISIRFVVDILIIAALIVIDQFTKAWAVYVLKDKAAIKLIDGVFELCYLENRGAAFGMLQNQKIYFVIIALLMCVVVCYMLLKLPSHKKYFVLRACMVLIGAGAVGNLIDRLNYEYVVDFFYFSLINFPIFNVADIYVSVSCAVLIISVLFFYKDEDLAVLKFGKKKEENGEV